MDVGALQGAYDDGDAEEYLGAVGKGSLKCWAFGEQGHFSGECVTQGGKNGTGTGQKGKGPVVQ